MSELKAYCVTDTAAYLFSTVVFAKNRGEARMLALRTDACEDADYIKIRAVRRPELDQYYHGNFEMDWNDAGDRVALVRYGNFSCSYEIDDPECDICPAKQWCDRYELERERFEEEG